MSVSQQSSEKYFNNRRKSDDILHFFVIGCGGVDKLTVFSKARAVAGAIPRMLGAVVFEGAAEVRTSGRGGRENTYRRFKSIDGKLWAQDGARWIENGGVWIVFALHKVAENIGGDHSVCHTPLVKACRNEHVGGGF